MAGRNRNTFLKRQKEMNRVQKAWEKMARRHGRGARVEGREAEKTSPEADRLGAGLAECTDARNQEEQV